jgi:F-type H+-transporting ATPase subunit b
MSPLDSLGINPGLLLVQIIAFVVLYTLLTRFGYDPISNVLRERRARIAKGLEDAAAAAQARMNAENEAQKILSQARVEASQLIEEARGRGDQVAKDIESSARADADKIRADARAAAEAARDTQLADLRGQVLAISVAMTERLIGETVDSKKQQALVTDFFSKVPAEAKKLSGSVEVVSAMPLEDKEQSKVKKELGADEVTFRVDPSILGGLIVRAGDRVVDGSIRSGLSGLSGRLN